MGNKRPDTGKHIEHVHAEYEFTRHAGVTELQQYVDSLRRDLLALGTMTPEELDAELVREPPVMEPATERERLQWLVGHLYELLGGAYIAVSGKPQHWSDCRVHCGPAYRPGPCNCDFPSVVEPPR